ncbi:MAG: class I SAM-dependent methyltransferase [Acidobacteriota bacterium]
MDLDAIAPHLIRGADGSWRPSARREAPVAYPDEANRFCFAVEERSFWFNYRNQCILDLVRRYPPAGAIADIGAGNGYVSLALQRAGFSTIVVEPGAAGVRNALSRGLDPVVAATLEGAGFLPGSLPAAGLFDVVEHVRDDERFLGEVHGLLRNGGRLYLTVPAFRALWAREDDLVGHHHRYDAPTLLARLGRAGFIVEHATYMFAPLALPLLLLRTLPSRLGWRTTLDPERIAGELMPAPGMLVSIVTAMLAGERALMRRGWRIPLGTSCLVAARAER